MNKCLVAIMLSALSTGALAQDPRCSVQSTVSNGFTCGGSSQTYGQPQYAPMELNAEPEKLHESWLMRQFDKLDDAVEKWKDPSARQPVDDKSGSSRRYAAPIDISDDNSVINSREAQKNDYARRNWNNPNYNQFSGTVTGQTIQPPKGYVDPYESKPLPKPGQLERYTNCTFNSPSCR